MSRSSNPNIPLRKEVRPWTPADVACYGIIGLLAYALSPPWVMLLLKLCDAPGIVLHTATILYAPLTLLRQIFPFLDTVYAGYRELLRPWMLGS